MNSLSKMRATSLTAYVAYFEPFQSYLELIENLDILDLAKQISILQFSITVHDFLKWNGVILRH